MDLVYDVVDKELNDFCSDLFGKVRVYFELDSDNDVGGYSYLKRFVHIGYKNIDAARLSGVVRLVDYVSVYKQCFHEYRHCMQYDKMFTGKDNYGMPDSLIRLMAEQAMINDKFVNYGHPRVAPSNYFKLSYEIDAEEYAIKSVQKYLSDKMPVNLLNSCICESVNKRRYVTKDGVCNFWWGELPVYSVEEGLADLHTRKMDCEHLVLQDEVDYSQLNEFSLVFMKDRKLLHEYRDLPVSEQNRYLVQYVCRNTVDVSKYYSVISDEFPETVVHSVEGQSKQKSLRLSGLKDAFGKITGLYDDVPDVQNKNSVSRQLPDVKYSDNEYDDIGFGV